jgi:hypothetical protein
MGRRGKVDDRMRLVLTQMFESEKSVSCMSPLTSGPHRAASGDLYEVVIDDWLNSGRSEQLHVWLPANPAPPVTTTQPRDLADSPDYQKHPSNDRSSKRI